LSQRRDHVLQPIVAMHERGSGQGGGGGVGGCVGARNITLPPAVPLLAKKTSSELRRQMHCKITSISST
ncbi:MAG: hypothetical protein KTR21_04820, partial [Rhodobacteraceae bacterium]|nr:hypothetical protein [Paracoccaceae bacterium]